MSAADLTARIDAARGDHEAAKGQISEAREMLGNAQIGAGETEDRGWFDRLKDSVTNVSLSDAVHFGLDVAGFVPGVGAIADGANALLYLAEGRETDAAISAAAMLVDGASILRYTDEALNAADKVVDVTRASDSVRPFGGGGPPEGQYGGAVDSPLTGRTYNPDQSGGPILPLSTNRIRIRPGGIDVIERHLARFGTEAGNTVQLQRLRDILDPSKPEVVAEPTDINFYAHELRESVRYRKEGFPSDGEQVLPNDPDAATQLWNDTHTATLEDLGHIGREEDFYHPDALKARREEMEEQARRG